MIELADDGLRVLVDPERGGQVVWLGAPGGPNALFHEPWDDPAPATGDRSYGSEDLDWLSHYRGGWQVMFPNAGSGCDVDGVRLPIHGEVSATPAEVTALAADRVRLSSSTRRAVRIERDLWIDGERPVLRVEERVTNTSARPIAVLSGHHPAFEVSPGARIDLPPGRAIVDEAFDVPEADLLPGADEEWPTVPGRAGQAIDLSVAPEGPVERVVYLPDRPAGWAAIRDPGRAMGMGLAWDPRAFPHLWLWEQVGGGRFPFFGRARIVALEPVSAWPSDGLGRAIERGRATWLLGGETMEAWITLTLFEPEDQPVRHVDREGRVSVQGAG